MVKIYGCLGGCWGFPSQKSQSHLGGGVPSCPSRWLSTLPKQQKSGRCVRSFPTCHTAAPPSRGRPGSAATHSWAPEAKGFSGCFGGFPKFGGFQRLQLGDFPPHSCICREGRIKVLHFDPFWGSRNGKITPKWRNRVGNWRRLR